MQFAWPTNKSCSMFLLIPLIRAGNSTKWRGTCTHLHVSFFQLTFVFNVEFGFRKRSRLIHFHGSTCFGGCLVLNLRLFVFFGMCHPGGTQAVCPIRSFCCFVSSWRGSRWRPTSCFFFFFSQGKLGDAEGVVHTPRAYLEMLRVMHGHLEGLSFFFCDYAVNGRRPE